MASEGLHEAAELLDEETIDHHRAMTSLCEELEAVDWYDQRVKATSDPSLAEVLAHNRDEEKEHASMTLEWLRRQGPQARPALAHVSVHHRVHPRDRNRGRIGTPSEVGDRRRRRLGIARHREPEGTRS